MKKKKRLKIKKICKIKFFFFVYFFHNNLVEKMRNLVSVEGM